MVGIFKALQVDHAGPNLMICTDSLASMYMIDKHMRCSSLHKECKHEELLSLIVEELTKKAREGLHVQLLKVKSHIGIEGNEIVPVFGAAHMMNFDNHLDGHHGPST